MRGRAQSRSKQRSPSSGAVAGKSLGMTMKLPMIANGHEESQNTVWPVVKQSTTPSVGVCSQQGKRPYQEDAYCIRQHLNKSNAPETHFFGLFDGHAGGKCSHHVATNLASTLVEDEYFSSNLPQAIKRAFYTCNEQFLKIAEKAKLHDGSTGLVALIRENKLFVANAGDCRAVLVHQGRPIPLSNDHKPTCPDEQKRIAALGGTVVYCMGVARVNRVLAVSRAFGNRTLKTVIRPDAELSPQRDLVEGDDFLVMASDGLWDVLKNKDVCDLCYYPSLQRKPQLIADELVNLALARGSMDNVTCIVVNLNDFRSSSDQERHSSVENSLNHGNLTMLSQQSMMSMTDTDDNATIDLSSMLHTLPSNSSLNTTTGKRIPRVNSGFDGLPKTNSHGGNDYETQQENANVASMIMHKKNTGNNASQSRMPFIKSGSTSTLSSMDPTLIPNFPMVGFVNQSNNGSNNNNNNHNDATMKLFTSSDGAGTIGRVPSNSKMFLRQGSLNAAEASQTFKNNMAGMRSSSRLGSARGGNNHSDHAAPISRASLNDLSTMINEFGMNNSY